MPHDLFISHSARDKVIADAVCAGMEAGGIRCWITPRDILTGQDWGGAIIDAIQSSRMMVIIFSKDANSSPHVMREVNKAVSVGIPILPFRIEDISPTGSMEYYLSTQHWLDALTPPLESHIQRLLIAARAYLALEPLSLSSSVLPVPSPPTAGKPVAKPKVAATAKLYPREPLVRNSKEKALQRDGSDQQVTILEETLANNRIAAEVVNISHGARVTRYEVQPAPGVRISRIDKIAYNLALALNALNVRVDAPIPGKLLVGIEVPNKELKIVDIREVLDSEAGTKSKSPIAFALGKDIAGKPYIVDLARMPHLLIAGVTNSGKSVCINSLICSMLLRATPKQVKFLLIDPKRVELSLFQSIPHLLAPVASEAKYAVGLLQWAIREMDHRYAMLAENGVRNIIAFNEKARLEKFEELPYIVIIIDELADLMMQAATEVENAICRLAQLARATGIHLVVATQRPSVNILTSAIKANIPSRIAFAVSSSIDSRVILDVVGAERLVGQGDMLYQPVEFPRAERIQGAFISEQDINKLVASVHIPGEPVFKEELMDIFKTEAQREELNCDLAKNYYFEDELLPLALDFIHSINQASTSMLQRKFRIGYSRAARMMDILEEKGYVGPYNGGKPREVINPPERKSTQS